MTLRFDDDPESNEDEWQRIVLDHLGIDHRVEIDARGRSTMTGPYAETLYRRHGLLYPANLHTHLAMALHFEGGSIITGAGGDEVFASPAEPLLRVLAGKLRPRPAHVASFARNSLPGREARAARTLMATHTWVRPEVRQELERRVGRAYWDAPRRYDAGLRHWVQDRYYVGLQETLAAVGQTARCSVVAPFLDHRFLASFATHAGFAGPTSRTDAMRELFGEFLPAATVSRSSKATFTAALHAVEQEFLDEWAGEGVPLDLVDPEVLRTEWATAAPHACTSLLLQSAYFTWKGVEACCDQTSGDGSA